MTVEQRCLPDAIDRLYRAVGALLDEPKELVGGQLRVAPSLWAQLADAASYTNADCRSAAQFGSRLPINVGALDLRNVVDSTVSGWTDAEGSTDSRLRTVAAFGWAPPQVGLVDKIATTVDAWVARAEQVLGLADRIKTISAPCPSCAATQVYRRDSGGDNVRQPALQIVAGTGCTCLACGAHWQPDRYLFLCRLLGYELPEGCVLE